MGERFRGIIDCARSQEISNLPFGCEQRLNLAAQWHVFTAGLFEEGGALVGSELDCGLIELTYLLPSLRRHKSSDE
jgi:hypothetical protein